MASTEEHSLNYGLLDRVVHRLVLRSRQIQLSAADIEDSMFGSSYHHIQAVEPIFVSSLPRAGTTLLLEVLSRLPAVATHLYRDMPMVMAPILWSRLSGPFQRRSEMRERAHGDGMAIGYDSPEAFEEIFWKLFWPHKYGENSIDLWTDSDKNQEASAFLTAHMRKIVALRLGEQSDGRYVSKNNANIARLDLIKNMFPHGKILVIFRHPIEHCASLLRQHKNFLSMHDSQPFVMEYMADIGHFEFGKLRRPIAFPSLESYTRGRDSLSFDFWLGYWVAAFEHILRSPDSLYFVSYENLCNDSESVLQAVCDHVGIGDKDSIAAAATLVKGAEKRARLDFDPDPELYGRAQRLHRRLMELHGPL